MTKKSANFIGYLFLARDVDFLAHCMLYKLEFLA
jgi:hypothetical protein